MFLGMIHSTTQARQINLTQERSLRQLILMLQVLHGGLTDSKNEHLCLQVRLLHGMNFTSLLLIVARQYT